jgi:hypothetical protein
MSLGEDFDALLRRFREEETDQRRGPFFAVVVRAVEERMRSTVISPEMIVAWFGPPDYFYKDATYIYRFDHRRARRNRDEHYFHFSDGRLVASGYNRRGLNDLSRFTRREGLSDKLR